MGHGCSEANKRLIDSKHRATGDNYHNRPIVGRSLVSILGSREIPFPRSRKKIETHWAAGRASGLQKTEWRGAGVVICLQRGADLHMAQLTPLPLTVSCFSKIQIALPFWYRLIRTVLEKGPFNMCVCLKVYINFNFIDLSQFITK